MNRFEQRKLMKNLLTLRRAIQKDVNIIADKLYHCGIFNMETKLEILNASNTATSNKQVQCGMLINKLIRSGKEAYGCFKTVLEDLGYHKVIQMMEKSAYKDTQDTATSWAEDKERTFVLPSPKAKSRRHTDDSQTDTVETREGCKKEATDELLQLNRMMTFVLTNMDDKDNKSRKANDSNKIKDILIEETETFSEFYKPLKCGGLNLTSESMAH